MQHYLETRTITSSSKTVGADLARHLLTRQHLGKTVVVCEKPIIVMSVVRKYWFKLARGLQKERASTLNAEKILQLTYDITHMQHMEFSVKPAGHHPNADVFFLTPNQLTQMPTHCLSVYILAAPSPDQLAAAIAQLPHASLLVDYSRAISVRTAQLLPKQTLEQSVDRHWQRVEQFFAAQNINLQELTERFHDANVVNESLDTLLGVSSQFMRIANEFLEALSLAQPFSDISTRQQLYDTIAMLNRRVHALTPGTLSQHFIQTFDGDQHTLHDAANEDMALALAIL